MAVSRLGGAEIVEPSEEVRLQLVQFVSLVVKRCDAANLPAYLTDFVTILQRTITDPYPEIKKVHFTFTYVSCVVVEGALMNRRVASYVYC